MFSRITPAHWSLFWRKLESLLHGGMPLMDSLRHLHNSLSQPALVDFVEGVISRLEGGSAFCEAVGQDHPLWYGILLSGECSGDLPAAVSRLADRLDAQISLRSQIVGALIYPLLVALLCLVVVVLLSSLVVPRFEHLFRTLDIAEGLPWLTQSVFLFSEFLQQWGGGVLLVVIVFCVFLFGMRKQWAEVYEKFTLAIPLFGKLYAQGVGLGVLESLRVVLQGGFVIDKAVEIAAKATASPLCSSLLSNAAVRIREGDSLSIILSGAPFWDATDIELLSIAERSGQLPQTTSRLSKILHERFLRQTALVTRLIEPLLIVIMASIIGILLVALFSPLMPLIGKLSGG